MAIARPKLEFRPIGMPLRQMTVSPVNINSINENFLNATNSAIVAIGQMWWDDHASHTVDTTGSSAIGFAIGSGTWANASSVLKVGVAAVDTSNGPTGRPVVSSSLITPDVAAVIAGNSGLTQLAWNEVVPTTGTRTIGHGELIAIFVQMTNRAGSDSILMRSMGNGGQTNGMPNVCTYNGTTFSSQQLCPNFTLRASDGTRGSLKGSYIISGGSTNKTFNSGSTPSEYGNVIQVPYPCEAWGVVVYGNISGDCDFVLYSDPTGTPVSRASVSVDANTVGASGACCHDLVFTTGFGYALTAGVPYYIAMKPTSGTNVTISFETLANTAHQTMVQGGGDDGYGASRSGGAIASQNSGLDRFFIGLLVGGGDTGGSGGGLLVSPGMRGGMQ